MLKFLLKNFKKIILFTFLIALFTVTIFVIIIAYDIYKTGFSTETRNIKEYQTELNDSRDKEAAAIFPKEIPNAAKEIQFYSYSSGLGGQTILLQFEIDKNYIKNEIDNSNLKEISSDEICFIFSHARGDRQKFNLDIYNSFYGIKRDYTNKDKYEIIWNGSGGIAVDKNFTHILYYYINPEG